MTDSVAIELQSIIGESAMGIICDRFGGQRIYIPHTAPSRAQRIADDFKRVIPTAGSVGLAYEQVASTHHVSPRTVQRIVCEN